MRRKLSQDLGFLVPAVHIRDNLDLPPNGYRINLGGVPVGEGPVYPEREMAINPGRVFGQLKGLATRDPAFGMEAVWIEPDLREHAQTLGYTVVDASTVVATHLSHIIQTHAHELLGHEEVQHLLNTLAKSVPKLIEDLVPRVCRSRSWCACCRGCWPSAYRSATCARSSKRSRSTRRVPRIPSLCRPRCASRWAARSSRTSPAWRRAARDHARTGARTAAAELTRR